MPWINFSYSFGTRVQGTVNQLTWRWIPYGTVGYFGQNGLCQISGTGYLNAPTFADVTDSSAAVANPLAMGNKYTKYKFKDMSRKFTFQNCSNGDMHMMLYEVIARRDMTKDLWGAGLSDLLSTLDDDDVVDHTKYPSADITIAPYKNPSFTLYMAHQFVQDWRIVKAIPVTVPASKYFTYVMKQKSYSATYNKLWQMNYSYVNYIGGYTKALVIAHKGQLGDNSSVVNSAMQVGFFDVTYNLFYEDKLKFCADTSRTQMTEYKNLGNVNTGTDANGNTTYFDKNNVAAPTLVVRAAEVVQVPASAAAETTEVDGD